MRMISKLVSIGDKLKIGNNANSAMVIIHFIMCAPAGNSGFCFPESLREDKREGKQNSLFPEGVHIKCFVI